MGSCPFCGGDVSDEVLQNGGRCPQCLIEIPGEETPTDPGEQAQAVQQAQEAAASKGGGRGLLMVAAAVALIGLGGGGWFVSRPAPDAASGSDAYMDDSEEFSFAPASAHQDLPVEEAPEAAPVRSGKRRGRTARTEPSGTVAAVGAAPAPPTGGSVAAGPETAPSAQGSMMPTGSPSGAPRESGASPPVAADPLGAFAMASGPASKGPQAIVLEKPGEIYEMVKKVLQVNGNQMKQCYEQRLKLEPGLKGTWTASFDILESGRTAKVSVKGEGVSDAELERCMKVKVEKWTFQRIAEATHIDKPFGFGR